MLCLYFARLDLVAGCFWGNAAWDAAFARRRSTGRVELGDMQVAGWPEREIGEIAARQRGLITRPQLTALGLSRAAIDHAVAREGVRASVCEAGAVG